MASEPRAPVTESLQKSLEYDLEEIPATSHRNAELIFDEAAEEEGSEAGGTSSSQEGQLPMATCGAQMKTTDLTPAADAFSPSAFIGTCKSWWESGKALVKAEVQAHALAGWDQGGTDSDRCSA